MKAATKPLSRLLRDLFRVEPLEQRVLLSADPVLGAAQIVLRPVEDDAASIVAQAYAAQAASAVATVQDGTVLLANGSPAAATPSQWLVVDTAQLAGGNGSLVVGGPQSNAVILVGEAGGGPLQLGGLVLVNPQDGGEVYLQSDLQLSGSLLIEGSGHTTIVSADTTTPNDIFILDEVLIAGNRALNAGTDGTGSIQLGGTPAHSVNGNGDATPDTLVLRAADNILFSGTVGGSDPLEGLTIEAVSLVPSGTDKPFNVTFNSEVTVNGNLLITATGTVTFKGQVILTSGGDLRILGADQVVFESGLVLQGVDSGGAAGDIFIEGNEIGLPAAGESVKGAGMLTLRPTNPLFAIEFGSPPASQTLNTLNIDIGEVESLADGFSKIVIGHQDGVHASASSGAVRLGATSSPDVATVRDPLEVYGSTIVVEDYGSSDNRLLVQGSILFDAKGDITLRNQVEAADGGGPASVNLYSATGQVSQANVTNDGISSEPLRAGALTVRAATGISLPFTEITSVSATNVTSGDLSIVETAAGGDVSITLLSQAAVSAGIALRTTSGNITVDGTGVNNTGTGATQLQAAGSAKAITVNQAIHSTGGTIRLDATGAITTVTAGTIVADAAAAIDVVSSAGAIQQGGTIQSGGGALTLNAAATLTMVDGVVARSQNGTGSVSLRAGSGNVSVSIVEADASMAVTAGGAILDGLTGTNPNLDGETAAVLVAAAAGIGTGATPLQTRVNSLSASNTTSGGLFVREATALRVAGGAGSFAIDLAGSSGAMALVSVDGAITIEKAVRSTGSVGHLLVQTGESAEGTTAAIDVRANVSSTLGSISLSSVDGIVVDDLAGGTAPTVSVAAATQTLDVLATDGIGMEAGATFSTGGGAARLQALGGNIALGVVNVGSGMATLNASGSITDVQADDGNLTPTANLVVGGLRLTAGGAIGAAGALLETQVATLAASAGGAVFLAEQDAATVGTVAAVTVNRIGALGTVASTPADGAASSGVTSGAALVLKSGGALSVTQNLQAVGNLLVSGSSTVDLAATAASTAGNVSLLATGTLSMAAAAVVSSTTGTVDIASSTADVSMADGSVARTDARTIRVQAGGTVTLGQLDARSAADRAGNTTNDHLTWGTVTVVAGAGIADNALESATTDVYGRNVRLQAAGGIGGALEHIELEAGVLSASAGAAGLFLTEASGLDVGTVGPVSAQRVALDGSNAAGPADGAQSGLVSGGALVVQTQLGSISLASSGGDVTAAGNILLKAQGGPSDLFLSAPVTSNGGSISLSAAQDVQLGAALVASGSGKTIDVLAQRHVVQAQNTAITSIGGNIALEAVTGNVTLESVNAGAGGIWLKAQNIVDGDAAGDTEVDLAAASAQLLASTAIGAIGGQLETSVGTLTAAAGGAIFINEADSLVVDRLQLNVDRIASDGTATATARAAQEDFTAPTVVLATLAGNLTINAGTASAAGVNGSTGNVRLEASGTLTVAATVDAGSGQLTALGAAGVTLTAAGALASSGGNVDVQSSGGAVTMADGAVVRTNAALIRVQAATNVTVGLLDARSNADRPGDTHNDHLTWGTVSVVAGGAIADIAAETATDIFGRNVRLQAADGIGAGSEHLELEAGVLSAKAGAAGLFVTEATGLEIDTTAAITAQRVGTDGVAAAGPGDLAQSGLTSGGALVAQTVLGGFFLFSGGAVNAAGNVLLRSQGTPSDLSIGAAVASSGGSIELVAGQDLLLGANVGTTTAGKSVVGIGGRNVTQFQSVSVSTVDGGISLDSATTGTITLETLAAGAGKVSLSGGSVVDGDAAGDTEVDITAAAAAITAVGAIGAAGAELETSIATLSASANGNLFITETDALTLDTVAASTQLIDATGAAQTVSSPPKNGLSGANVVLRTLGGNLASTGTSTVAATGTLLLQAGGAGSDLTLGTATSAAGALSLAAARDVVLAASVTTTAAGSTIDVLAGGRIDAQQGSAIVANNANVQLQADGGSVTLESVAAGTGFVRISGTDIIDGDVTAAETEVDVTAARLLLTASGSAGTGANPLETTVTTLSASAAGTLAIAESDGLVLDTVAVSVNRVAADGSTAATTTVTQSHVNGATVVVRTLAGPLVSVAGGGVVGSSGNVLLRAGGAGGDLTLGAGVTSTGGNISLDAGRDLAQAANVAATGAGKTIDVLAAGSYQQSQGVSLSTSNGHAAIAAGGSVTLETINVGTGNLSLAGTSVVDGDAAGDTELDVTAAGLRINATAGDVGSATNAVETAVATLSAAATGSVFITESDALNLATVSVTVNRVASSGVEAVQAAITQGNVAGAAIVLRTLAGSLTTAATGAVNASGNVLLQAGGATSDLGTAAGVISTGGHVSLDAGQDLVLGANVATAGAGNTVDLLAGRNFTQAQGTAATANNGNIALQAVGVATIETIDAGTGLLRVAAGSVVDGDISANETEVDLRAAGIQLLATGAIGTGSNALETTTATLTVAAGGNAFLAETDAVTIGSLTVNVQRVNAAGASAATANAAQAGLAAATTVLQAKAGSIDNLAGATVTAAGNLLLQASGAGSDVTLNAAVTASGHATIEAVRNIQQNANVTVSTASRTLLFSAGGTIAQAQGVAATATDGLLVLSAVGNVTLETLQAGSGSVKVIGAGVIDGDADGDSEADVLAGALRITATAAVGSAANMLETSVATLSAQATGSIFVTETDALTLGTVTVASQRVAADGSASLMPADPVQPALSSGAAAVIKTLAGSLATSAAASASGNLLLKAGGPGADLVIGAATSSSGGSVDLLAAQDVLLNANVSTAGAGKSVHVSAQRSVAQAQDTSVATNNGGIAISAGAAGAITIETLTAGTGKVDLSGGSVADGDAAGDTEVDISAAALALTSLAGVGVAGAALETSVDTLSVSAATDVFITESTALALDTVATAYQLVDEAGAAQDVSSAPQNGVTGRNVVLRTVAGNLSSAGTSTVAATGTLLLQAGGTGADLALATATSSAGTLSLAAARNVTLSSSVTTTAAGSTIDILAGAAIDAQQGSAITANNANVQLQADAGNVTFESIAAGTGAVRISAANIVDGDGAAGETEVDVTAAGLLLTATGAIGSGANPLETTVGTLSASAGGTIAIVESDALVLDTVSVSVNRVGTDGAALATPTATQSNLAGGAVAVRTLAGTLTSNAGGAVSASGNLLLQSGGASSDLALNAAVGSSGGHVTLDAARDLLQAANVAATGAGKTLLLQAGGNLTQSQGTSVASNNGDVALSAGATLTVETVNAGTARVSLAGASIVDGDAFGDSEADVLAGGMRAVATGAIGSAGNALETTVTTLAAAATGNLFLTETNALDLASVSVTVNRVAADGSDAAQPALTQGNVSGAIVVVRTLAGALSSQASGAVSATGNLLLQAGGAASDLLLGAGVTSSGGAVSLAAGQDLLLGAAVSATGAGSTIDLVAGRNAVQAQGTAVTSNNGNIALQAAGSATVESLDAGTGMLRLAAASIVDGDAAAGETEVDLRAAGVQLATSGAVGAGSNAIELAAGILTVAAGGNAFLSEADAVSIGSLTVNVQRVDASGVASATANAAQTGLSAANGVLQAQAGTITASAAVTTTGNLLLQALGAGSDLVLDAALSAGGHATLDAGRDLLQNANVATTTAGRSLLLVAGGSIVQAQGVTATAADGALVLTATGSATLETLQAGTGSVKLAVGSLIDGDTAGDAEADVLAASLRITASGAVGAAGNALETTVGTLSVQSGGDAFLSESDAVTLGAVTVAVQRVAADGSNAALAADGAQAAVNSGGVAVIRTVAGALATTDAVTAAGNLLLAAGGAADLTVGATLTSTGGNASLSAGRDLLLNANLGTTADGKTIDLLAQANVLQTQGTAIASTNGNVAMQAVTGSLTLETITAGSGGVWAAAAAIVDGDAAGDAEVDITAASAQLLATGAIGASGSALETAIATLSARAGGALFVTESTALTIGSLNLNVNRVDATGAATATANAAQAGLAGATVVVRTLDGALGTTATVAATGNLLLQASGTAGDVALGAAVTATGAMSVSAARDVVLATSVTGSASIDLLAQRGLVAQEGSTITAGNANVLLQALGGDLTLESVAAGAGTVRLVGANIVDGDAAGDTESDVSAGKLQVVASGAIGSTANALETTVGTLAASAGAAIAIVEADTLLLDAITATYNRVGIDGISSALPVLTLNDVTSSGGNVLLTAQGDLSMAAQADVRTSGAATINVNSVTGSVLMDPDFSVLQTGSGDIRVTAERDIRPGGLITDGKSFLDARNGKVLIAGDLQRDGEDIDVFADDVTISVPVSSPGAVLRIGPLDGTVPVIVGGGTPSTPALHLDTAELALLQDGFAQVVIGSNLANQVVELRGTTTPLLFRDPLVLNASGAGGAIQVAGSLTGEKLDVLDSGTRTTLTAATIRMQGDLVVRDQVSVSGANTLQAGTAGAGTVRFTNTVTGQGGTGDTLALSAQGGSVVLEQAVSNLDGLVVTNAVDVTFGAAVSLNGDLVISATGTVTFAGPLTLTQGARLIVNGGGRVVFASSADLGTGGAVLDVSAINATGGAGSIRGQGVLEVRGTSAAAPVHIGAGAPAGALQVGDDVLRAVGAGFSTVRIGTAFAAVTVGESDFSITGSPVEVRGASIALAGSGAGVRVGTSLALHASGSLTTSGLVTATRASDLVLTSDSERVDMAAGSSIRSLGGSISLNGLQGVAVAGLDARAADGSAGTVNLGSVRGVVTDANRDAAVDIYARAVQLTGTGPALGGGDVLEVVAQLVRIDVPEGVVTRESGADGRVYFNVLRGSELVQALVAVGPTSRITSDADAFVAGGGLQNLASGSGFRPSALSLNLNSATSVSPTTNSTTQAYLGSSAGLQTAYSGLVLSQRLLADAGAAFATGQEADLGAAQVDYWSESLSV